MGGLFCPSFQFDGLIMCWNEKNGGQAGFYLVAQVKYRAARLPTLPGSLIYIDLLKNSSQFINIINYKDCIIDTDLTNVHQKSSALLWFHQKFNAQKKAPSQTT